MALKRGEQDRVEFYLDDQNQWRWRFRASGNGKILADSGQGYNRSKQAWDSCRRVVGRAPSVFSDPIDESDVAAFVLGDRDASERWDRGL